MAFSLLTGIAQAEKVYLCEDKNGKKTWSNIDCPHNTTGEIRDVQADNVLNSEGLRNWSRNNPQRYKAENSNQAAINHAEKQEKRQRCENAKLDYSFESTWKSHRANPAAKGAIMQKECAGL